MNCILNTLSDVAGIIAATLGSVCSSKKEDGGEVMVQPMPRPVRIPRRVVMMSLGRRSFAALAASVAKAGAFDNTTPRLAYASTARGRFADQSSDDTSANASGFRVIAGGHADVGRSASARGFYNGGSYMVMVD